MTERIWAYVTRVNDNGVMSGSETEVLRMATKSESVRDECRFVTDEKWALRKVMIK